MLSLGAMGGRGGGKRVLESLSCNEGSHETRRKRGEKCYNRKRRKRLSLGGKESQKREKGEITQKRERPEMKRRGRISRIDQEKLQTQRGKKEKPRKTASKRTKHLQCCTYPTTKGGKIAKDDSRRSTSLEIEGRRYAQMGGKKKTPDWPLERVGRSLTVKDSKESTKEENHDHEGKENNSRSKPKLKSGHPVAAG